MDKMKDPAMLLATVDTVAIAGISWYFYKRDEEVRETIKKIETQLALLTTDVNTMKKSGNSSEKAVSICNQNINDCKEQVREINNKLDFTRFMEEDIYEIAEVMRSNNMNLQLPSDYRRGKRSGDRRDPRRSPTFQGTQQDEMDYRYERTGKYEQSYHNEWSRPSRESEKEYYRSEESRNRQEVRPQPRYDQRSEIREQPREQLREQPREQLREPPREQFREQRLEQKVQDLSVDDFINEVRGQEKS